MFFQNHQKKILALVAVGILLPAWLGVSWLSLENWASTPISNEKPLVFQLDRGVSLQQFARTLKAQGLIDSEFFFYLWVRFGSNYRRFQAGNYEFLAGGVAPREIAAKIQAGDVYHPLTLTFTIPEGYNLSQILAKIQEAGPWPFEDLRKASEGLDLRKKFGIKANSLEGYLFPASYRFYDHTPEPRAIFEAMATKFFEMLPVDIEQKLVTAGLDLHQALIIASLIEKETAQPSELELVSEVIWRRLKNKAQLGIDASIIYGINNFDGNLRRKHLLDRDNPFNLRVHRGLPPGPICSPGTGAFLAVFNPTNEGNYFYVLLPGTEKRHHFSKTLKEHNKYVAKLVKSQLSQK